jgi:hypothetical protein
MKEVIELKDIVGKIFSTNNDGEIKVLEKSDKKSNGTFLYLVKFLNTGSQKYALKCNILNGRVKDNYVKRVCGIGYLGEEVPYNEIIHDMWSKIIGRCYNPKKSDYKYYGGKGVTVCEEWHCYNTFYHDLKKVEGYDVKLFEQRKIFLDKDFKQSHLPHNQRVYSLETCIFLTHKQNMQYTDTSNKEIEFYSLDKNGNIGKHSSLKGFANELNVVPSAIWNALNGLSKTCKGYQLSYDKNTLKGEN